MIKNDSSITFDTLQEAQEEHANYGGILLVLDDGKYCVCNLCVNPGCGECGRTDEWIESLAPSWSEAAPENARRDPRNKDPKRNKNISQTEMF